MSVKAEQPFKRVAILGLGLIGGSIAAAMKARDFAAVVVAFDMAPAELARGLALGLIDEAAESAEEAVQRADLVILAVPVLAIEPLLEQISKVVSESAVITDVGSVKSPIIDAARRQPPNLLSRIVPGHPIAGSEQHGVQAANADLFLRHKVILTPLPETHGASLAKLTAFWQALDADVVEMSPAHHDAVLAQTSHLPHLLAYALIDTLSMQGDSLEIFDYAAGGLRDFSRIAASDPVMWRDIYQANSGPVLTILDRYMKELMELRELIANDQSEELTAVFTRAKLARDHFSVLLSQRGQTTNSKEIP